MPLQRGWLREGAICTSVSRTRETIERAAREIQAKHGVSVQAHALDLSKGESVKTLLDAAGNAEILVNNAGAIPGGDLQAIDEARWREAWNLNVFGYINLCRAFYAAMQKKGAGVIINVTGLAADRLDANYSEGPAGNAFINAFSGALGSNSFKGAIRV